MCLVLEVNIHRVHKEPRNKIVDDQEEVHPHLPSHFLSLGGPVQLREPNLLIVIKQLRLRINI